ncbi:MAG: hypothetical protein JNJ88_04835 [Planctomycetes bacterium]|nr:hypothetical protein [Planctomycetota bacterium]
MLAADCNAEGLFDLAAFQPSATLFPASFALNSTAGALETSLFGSGCSLSQISGFDMFRKKSGVGRTPFSIPPVPSIQGTQRTVQSV